MKVTRDIETGPEVSSGRGGGCPVCGSLLNCDHRFTVAEQKRLNTIRVKYLSSGEYKNPDVEFLLELLDAA
jgi:hypothetical protein